MNPTYEIRPHAETDDGERYDVVPTEASFWTLYRRGADGLALAVADLVSREDAEAVVRELEGAARKAGEGEHLLPEPTNAQVAAHERRVRQILSEIEDRRISAYRQQDSKKD